MMKTSYVFAGLLSSAILFGCSPEENPVFKIVSGSENQILEPIVQKFCKENKFNCVFEYQGSLDIGQSLRRGNTIQADAIWPASSLWIDLYDSEKRVDHIKSISHTPVLLGVQKSLARSLGWTDRDISKKEIVEAVEQGKLGYLMTSATQSNSGVAAYLSMLASSLGKDDIIEKNDLSNEEALSNVRKFLSGVVRSSGSSGWLADLYTNSAESGTPYPAMWNYEAVLKETNDKLISKKLEPLQIIYPSDGVSMSDSPLGYIDRQHDKKYEEFFIALQNHLLSKNIQIEIAQTGRRVSDVNIPLPNDPSNGLHIDKKLTSLPYPAKDAILEALRLYQEALRIPSATAFCLDFSGSMSGVGETQLHKATTFLLSPESTKSVFVQWTDNDIIIASPFDSRVRWMRTIHGKQDEQIILRDKITNEHADGGTDFYTCASESIKALRSNENLKNRLPAVVIMTDGASQGNYETFEKTWSEKPDHIPVFGILFGSDASKKQLEKMTKPSGGRIFDGTKNLLEAFRSVRGYN